MARIAVKLAAVAIERQGKVSMRGRVIWGDISRYVNGENVLGGVAYKNKVGYQ